MTFGTYANHYMTYVMLYLTFRIWARQYVTF